MLFLSETTVCRNQHLSRRRSSGFARERRTASIEILDDVEQSVPRSFTMKPRDRVLKHSIFLDWLEQKNLLV
jgi:hypothetical protein